MTGTNGVNDSPSIPVLMNNIDMGTVDSLQFTYAKLQTIEAQICKNSAMSYMKQIESIQEEQKKVADAIARMRKLQQEATVTEKEVEVPQDLRDFFKARGLDSGVEQIGKAGVWCAEKWAAKTWKDLIDPDGSVEKNSDGLYRWVSKDFKEGGKGNKDKLTYGVTSLTNYQDSISNKTQTLMVYLQDYISQYNSFVQGASGQITQGGQTLTRLTTFGQ